MNDEWHPPEVYNKIVNKCPLLFSQGNKIQLVDIGWVVLIDNVCQVIEKHIHLLPEESKSQVYAEQIKSKFGGLRFYMSHETPYITGALEMAELLSHSICEKCGDSGKPATIEGWVLTLCPIHFEDEKSIHEKRMHSID